MKYLTTETEDELALSYQWKHKNKCNRMEASAEKPSQPRVPGSEEEFITEHYWGYSKYNDTATFEYNVQHPA